MKLQFRYLLLIGLVLPLMLLSSCKSKQKVDPNAPVDEAALEAVAQARAAAEESRSLAEYVECADNFPEEWRMAEGDYAAAKEGFLEPVTMGDAMAQISGWKAIGALYDDMYNKALPQFAEVQQKRLVDAKNAAADAGAEELVPDRVAQADALAGESKTKYDNNDLDGAVKDGKEAIERYKVLETVALARKNQEEADLNNFYSRDPDNYMLAAEAGNAAVDSYDEGNLKEAQASAQEAFDRFAQVNRNGWTSIVEEKASVARENRSGAMEAKANVAVKQEYESAERTFNNANSALKSEEYAVASELFEQAGRLYKEAENNALTKRQVAETALREAEQKLAESQERAQAADEFIGGEK